MSDLNLSGKTLGRFEILEELGRGGMAVVYKARQTDLDRIVALKILPPALTHDPGYVARFRQEARSAARLEHPHIMPIYEVGESDGLHYIAMKYIQGRTLKDLLHEEGALSVTRAAQILAQVGEALDHAHRQGVIHRDIKPSNIMITLEGWAYLTDFGLARGTGGTGGLTMAGTVMGTPEYMSPEQAQGLPNVGPPTDIYALGVVLYELLTGVFPFKADTPMAMLAARLLQTPTPPRDVRGDLPTTVEDVIMRALARKPEARFGSSAEMVAALRRASGIGSGDFARPPATPPGGQPAYGATLAAAPPVNTPPSNPPYVQRPDAGAPTAPARPATPQATPAWQGSLPTQQPLPPPPTVPPGPAAAAPRSGGNGPVIAAVVGVVALVLALGGGAIALLGRGRGDTPPPGPTSSAASLSAEALAAIESGDAAIGRPGELGAALESYQQALEAAPGQALPLSKLAITASLRADWAAAESYASQLLDAAGAAPADIALGHALRADALMAQGDLPSARAAAEQAIVSDPELALAHAVLAHVRAQIANDEEDREAMDEALVTLDDAVDTIDSEPQLIQAMTRDALGGAFAQEYYLSGDQSYLDQSIDSYNQAIDLQPSLAIFASNLGYLYSNDGSYAEARDQFEAALDLDPEFVEAQAGIGWSFYQEGVDNRARDAFEEAIDLNPDSSLGYYGLGRLAFDEAGDAESYAAAAEQFEAAIERNPRDPVVFAYLGEARLFEGFNYEDQDAKDDAYVAAEEAYRSAIAINDRYAFAINGLGWILQYQERYQESIREFERAAALDDTFDEIYVGMGWSLFYLDRFAEAEQRFRDGIARDDNGNYYSAHFGLGRALEEQGRVDEARAAYQQALAIFPDYTAAQEALARIGE